MTLPPHTTYIRWEPNNPERQSASPISFILGHVDNHRGRGCAPGSNWVPILHCLSLVADKIHEDNRCL